MKLSDQEVKDLYLNSPYNKRELNVLKKIPQSQIKRATSGVTKSRVWKTRPPLDDRLADLEVEL
jgi:hypothetical protein